MARHLTLVPVHTSKDHSLIAVIAALVMVVGAVAVLRVVQGGPPAQSAGFASAEASAGSPLAGETSVVVGQGDTLWGLARSLAPDHDPRPIVDAIADRNGGTVLRAGDTIVLPAEVVASFDVTVVGGGFTLASGD